MGRKGRGRDGEGGELGRGKGDVRRRGWEEMEDPDILS